MASRWPMWLRVLTAPVWLPAAMCYLGLMALILPLLVIVGLPASCVVTAFQRRRWRRAHVGEFFLLCGCVNRKERYCDIALRKFHQGVVSTSLPERCRLVQFEDVVGREGLVVLKVASAAVPKQLPAICAAVRLP